MIRGALSDFGISNGTQILAAYMDRDSYDVFRRIDIYNYGAAGFGLRFFQTINDTPISSASVSCTIYYI